MDVMTTAVVTVGPDTTVQDLAKILSERGVSGVPVVENGRLVGIISRANLVRALAAIDREPATGAAGDDRDVRARLLTELNGREWARVWPGEILVQDGVVHLWVSDTRSAAERGALHVAAENVPGVRRVEEHVVPVPIFPAF